MQANTVKEVNTTLTSKHTSEILWDGRDGAGSLVPQGQYVLQLNIFTNKGDATTSAGAVLIK